MIFNRPDTTRIVFDEIKKQKPKFLYIAADGPRESVPGEKELCEEAKKIVGEIDWDCELKTLFSEKNLGIRQGPPTAINWFFDNVDEGIILEDDCVPDKSFFSFCSIILEKYRDDKRIMQIAGNNFQSGIQRGDGSYYFSKFNHLWGWATWKRAWKMNDDKMTTFPIFKTQNKISDVWDNKHEQKGWLRTLEKMHNGKLNTWEYPWLYTFWSNSGLCISPNKNLVTNIGFGANATHTKTPSDKLSKLKTESILKITHPTFVLQDKKADEYTYKTVFKKTLLQKIYTKILLKLKK